MQSQPKPQIGQPITTTSHLALNAPQHQAHQLLEEQLRTSRRARELAAALDRQIADDQRHDQLRARGRLR